MPLLALFLAACAVPGDSSDSAPGCRPADLTWPEPTTTLTATVVAGDRLAEPTELNPAFPEGLAAAEAVGLGAWATGPGEARVVRDDLAPGHLPGLDRRSLAFFLHESDAQIADTESPTRLMLADAPGATQSAARPQEVYALHALDALVRTTNALHAQIPLDFALITGDNADSSQTNELAWFRDTLDGTEVKPDSGEPNSQFDDDCNDPIAAFTPQGLDMPWYAVAGNHDVLVQGNFDPEAYVDSVLGSSAPAGTRDLSLPGGPVATVTPADPARAVLERSDIAAMYLDSPSTPGPVGHGFTDADVANDAITWSAMPMTGIRLLALDANPSNSGDAQLSAAERDTFLIPALNAAQAAHELVILTSHYAMGNLEMEGGGVLSELLANYPNVVLTVAGHSHVNDVAAFGAPDDPGAFWEVRTSSTVDWPSQGRLVELVDNGDGTLSIFGTIFDALAPEGSMSARARALTLIDWQSGWRWESGPGELEDRNVELIQRLPEGWSFPGGEVRSLSLP